MDMKLLGAEEFLKCQQEGKRVGENYSGERKKGKDKTIVTGWAFLSIKSGDSGYLYVVLNLLLI